MILRAEEQDYRRHRFSLRIYWIAQDNLLFEMYDLSQFIVNGIANMSETTKQ